MGEEYFATRVNPDKWLLMQLKGRECITHAVLLFKHYKTGLEEFNSLKKFRKAKTYLEKLATDHNLNHDVCVSGEALKKVYRKLFTIYHPDKKGDEETFKKIQRARDTIKKEKGWKRRRLSSDKPLS